MTPFAFFPAGVLVGNNAIKALKDNAEPLGSALFLADSIVVSINMSLESNSARAPVGEGAHQVAKVHGATAIDIFVWVDVAPSGKQFKNVVESD